MAERKNRNLKTELEIDVEYIDEIVYYINRGDGTSAKQMLDDWKRELLEELAQFKKKGRKPKINQETEEED